MGNVQINLLNGKTKTLVILKDYIHAPNLAFTLLSVSQIAKVTRGVNFKQTHAEITHLDGTMMACLPELQGMYHLHGAKHDTNDHVHDTNDHVHDTNDHVHDTNDHVHVSVAKMMLIKSSGTLRALWSNT
jgi:hypothetical protein